MVCCVFYIFCKQTGNWSRNNPFCRWSVMWYMYQTVIESLFYFIWGFAWSWFWRIIWQMFSVRYTVNIDYCDSKGIGSFNRAVSDKAPWSTDCTSQSQRPCRYCGHRAGCSYGVKLYNSRGSVRRSSVASITNWVGSNSNTIVLPLHFSNRGFSRLNLLSNSINLMKKIVLIITDNSCRWCWFRAAMAWRSLQWGKRVFLKWYFTFLDGNR